MEDFFEDLENSPKPNIFRRIQLWWNHDGKYYHKYLREGIRNVIYWFPIIWKDRNWDSHYIFEILKHKLKAQAKYIGDRDMHTRAKQDARRMRLCISLMQKVQEEDYTVEYMGYYGDRHWFTDCEDNPESVVWNSEITSENFNDYFKKYPLIYKRVMKGEGVFTLDGRDDNDLKRVIALNIAHLNHDRARKLLFKIMQENIEGWWD